MISSIRLVAFAGFISVMVWSAVTQAELPPLPETQSEGPPLVLGVGEQRLLRVPGLARYSLGSNAARAKALPASGAKSTDAPLPLLLIKGIAPGICDLWVWKQDGSSEHRSLQVQKSIEMPNSALMRALGSLEETEVIHSGAGVLLRGETRSLRESFRIAALAEAYPKDVIDRTEPDEALLESARKKLEQWARNGKYSSHLTVETIGKDLWIRGSLENPLEQTGVRKAALAIYPRTQIDISSLPDNAPTVHFKVFLLELKKTRASAFGLQWPPGQEGAFRVTTSAILDLLQLDLTIQALEGEGSIRVLSKPELVVRAPGEAELFSGGEIPIQQQGRFYSNVTWKAHGLTLKLKVTHTTEQVVRLDVFTEISHLDSSISGSVPGIQANRMKTQVDARYGAPLLLSGLLQQGTRQAARGLPLLRQIPVLGALFGSEDYLNEKSELVAILLPTRSLPEAPTARFASLIPKGPLPSPRNWLSPDDEKNLRASKEFPWNALQ